MQYHGEDVLLLLYEMVKYWYLYWLVYSIQLSVTINIRSYTYYREYIYRLDNNIWSRILLGYIHAQRLSIQNIQVQFIIQNRYHILDIEACRICTLATLSNTTSQIECCIKTFVDNEAYRQEYRNLNAINKQMINVDPDIINSLL